MPAPPPAFYPGNVLEDAILTLEPDGAVAEKPVARVADRDIGLECEDLDVVGVRMLEADLGIGTLPTVDTWLFLGAAITGVAFTLESSPDHADWTPRGTVTPAADVAQLVAFPSTVAPRYWRMTWEDPPAPVRLTEVSLSQQVTFRWKPAFAALREPQIPNVTLVESASGRTWGIQRGARRWSAKYLMAGSPDVDRTTMLEMLDTLADGAKAFWLLDLTGTLRWVRIQSPVEFTLADRAPAGDWDIPLDLIEELP